MIFLDITVICTALVFVGLVWSIPVSNFLDMLIGSIKLSDLFMTLEKGVFYGAGVAVISCYFSLGVKKSITEIPKAAINSVISSLVLVFSLEMIITVFSFLI